MKKYIERELALSFPFANGRYDEENANIDFICGCETYKEYLETLPCVEVREWIPVTERLPKEDGWYLVTYLWNDNIFVDTAEWFIDDWKVWSATEILAWMPLPNPYYSMGENYGFETKEEADLWMNSKPVGEEEI